MDGAVVTDARLSQLFDPIARLVDAYPERRNGPYTNHHHQGSRNSTEYTHLTAYPAIIEPATYADDDNGGSTSRYNWIASHLSWWRTRFHNTLSFDIHT